MIAYTLKIRNKVTSRDIVVSYRATMDDEQKDLTTGSMKFNLETANVNYLTNSQFVLGIIETVILRLNQECKLDRIEVDQSANRLQLQVPKLSEFRTYIQSHHLLSHVAQSCVANGHQAINVSISTPFKLG
ncbi:hypothetical protein [Secundilactobacillus silagei]|uniref:Uncharacterized protein n=1 Tax=Secundilactobacillus silagei JCM 19001 TaxID=1302250 RepID=A0A1Z5IHL0_9LACO|nr:hypothetical protein [Secundilactobacillus silagei]TDG72450.1 hypothetical protein C5L25_001826 [Secundilactobacillus silagei JCM 19001]GAX01257.1 hypothetical protein IWT126_01283 [Secundilactobacillus silagei JCM 19001]